MSTPKMFNILACNIKRNFVNKNNGASQKVVVRIRRKQIFSIDNKNNYKRSRCEQRVGLPSDSEYMRYDGKE